MYLLENLFAAMSGGQAFAKLDMSQAYYSFLWMTTLKS